MSAQHKMTDDPDGRVRCSCGAVSPRFGTKTRANQWKAAHRRAAKS